MNDLRIKEGKPCRLKDFDPEETGGLRDKPQALEKLFALQERMDDLQKRLYAEGHQSLLIVLQAMDTGGKDGTIRSVMRGVNPQGCHVTSFKAPSPEELSHDFLWRVHANVPRAGNIGIFNRSHYEDVLITRVHDLISDKVAERRMRQIVDFEKLLTKSHTRILKFYLHISKDEQRKRLQSRIDDSHKHWKFNPQDLEERKFWKKYIAMYEEVISATSTEDAPWYIIPANHKWARNVFVADIIVKTLEDMKPKFPPPSPLLADKKFKVV